MIDTTQLIILTLTASFGLVLFMVLLVSSSIICTWTGLLGHFGNSEMRTEVGGTAR